MRFGSLSTGSPASSYVANSITVAPGGNLEVYGDSGFGAAPTSVNPTAIVLNGGRLGFNTIFGSTLSANRGVYLDANGGTIALNNGVSFTLGSVISGVGGLTISSVSIPN